jgi:hypothetical protein
MHPPQTADVTGLLGEYQRVMASDGIGRIRELRGKK